MPDYGGGPQLRGGSAPGAPAPQGLNPRLLLLRDHLAECEKSVFEIRGRLGTLEPPAPGDKRAEEPNNAGSNPAGGTTPSDRSSESPDSTPRRSGPSIPLIS